MIYISIIIDILSYILPFINEISNILTASNLKPFRGLYKRCVDRYLLPSNVIKIISKNKICTPQELRSKIIIDILGLLGIIINIAKNAIQFGYLTSILSGIVVVMISFVIPNLYLQRIIISIKKYYKLKYRNSSIIIGLFFIAFGIVVMIGLEKLIQNITRDIVIDPELEKYIYPR